MRKSEKLARPRKRFKIPNKVLQSYDSYSLFILPDGCSKVFTQEYFLNLSKYLLHNPLLQILRQIHLPDIRGSVVGCDFGHVVLDHQLDELFEGGGLRIPT